MKTDRIRAFAHITPGRVAALLVAACVAGVTWQQMSAKAAREQQDRENRHRIHMMDYEMGRRRDDIMRLFNASAPCRDRMAFFCALDVQGDHWFWFRQSLKGRDVLDVEIPWGAEKGQKRVRVRLYMRDQAGNLARVEPGLVPLATATLTQLGVSQAAITACAGANEPKTIADGRLKLVCQRFARARFTAQNGNLVEGVQWHAEVSLP